MREKILDNYLKRESPKEDLCGGIVMLMYDINSKKCAFIEIFADPKEVIDELNDNNPNIDLRNLITIELENEVDEDACDLIVYINKYYNIDEDKYDTLKLSGDEAYLNWVDIKLRDIAEIRELFWNIEGLFIWDEIRVVIEELKNKSKEAKVKCDFCEGELIYDPSCKSLVCFNSECPVYNIY